MSYETIFYASMEILLLILAVSVAVRARRFHRRYMKLSDFDKEKERKSAGNIWSAGAVTHLSVTATSIIFLIMGAIVGLAVWSSIH